MAKQAVSIKDKTFDVPHSLYPNKKMPAVGLGTWQAEPGAVENAVYEALKVGYRHIDCAAIYGNEREVGNGIKRFLNESGISRDEIWVTSKLWCNSESSMVDRFQPDRVGFALQSSLNNLQLEYLDLYLMHWPQAMKPGNEWIPKDEHGIPQVDNTTTLDMTWHALEALLGTGKVRNIGISNFCKSEVEDLLKKAKHQPDAIQNEIHPYLQQKEFNKWCKERGMVVEAYSPFGNLNPTYKTKDEGRIIDQEVIKKAAEKYGRTPSQVILSWNIAHGNVVLPKSSKPERLRENLEVFALEAEDVAAIDKIDKHIRYSDISEELGKVFFKDEKPPHVIAEQSLENLIKKLKAKVGGNK